MFILQIISILYQIGISLASEYNKIAFKLIETGERALVDMNMVKFKGEFFDQCKSLNFFPSELYIFKDDLETDDFKKLNKEKQGKYIYDKLKGGSKGWQDEENISGPFEEGAEYFGYDKMFKYLGMNNRHDALYNFRKITQLAKESGLKPEQFYGQILNQVKMDDAQYGEEEDALKSYALLNNIADTVDITKMGEILEKAKQYKDINKLQDLATGFEKKENIFADWKSLRKYYDLIQLLGKAEVLDELKELKTQGKEKLYKYIETLAFHPNVDMQKVMQFWRNPESFLDVGEKHAPEAHDRKKPSNYVEIPHLDLTAENLRDGLVEGDLDKLQTWQALEIEYKIGDNAPSFAGRDAINRVFTTSVEIKEDVLKALGSRSKGIKGEAQDPGKLFSELNKTFKAKNLQLADYLEKGLELSEEVRMEIERKLYDEKIGLEAENSNSNRRRDEAVPRLYNENNKDIPCVEYRVKINFKSDPDAVVAGNDTACCMPFGSGKNNVYTYNPICSLFTVQKKAGNNWRTIAQSVLTKDIDIKKNVSEIISQMQAGMIKMDNLVDEDILTESERIITGDNIEVNNNFKENPEKDKILKYLYSDFFQEYIKMFGEQENLDKGKMIIGKGYTDAMTNLEEVANTYVPLAPVGYSDNIGEKSLKLDLTKSNDNLALEKKVNLQDKKMRKDLVPMTDKKVEHLTFMDSLRVAYLKGKAYHDNKSLMEYLHNMENGLIAKDINNVSKERVNLSLKYVDDKKKMQGYILAYEGKMDKVGEDIIFIADLAASPESKMAGGRLIKEFIGLYKKYYLDEGKLIPIIADAREKTSYQIIIKQAEKMGKKLGVKFKIEELKEEEKGDDMMHLVKIVPERDLINFK